MLVVNIMGSKTWTGNRAGEKMKTKREESKEDDLESDRAVLKLSSSIYKLSRMTLRK